MIRKVLEMANRNEIRNAHEIVDKIDSIYEREALRKLLPPRPEFTFGETIEALKGMASEDDVHLWKIIGRLERFEKDYRQLLDAGEKDGDSPVDEFPEGSVAVRDGEDDVWVRGDSFWSAKGSDLNICDSKILGGGFHILRFGF